MSVSVKSLEDYRQSLIQYALDQIQRLQSSDLNKRDLASAAMQICDRDTAIRLLQGVATGSDDSYYYLQPNPTQPNTTQPRAESATFHSGQE